MNITKKFFTDSVLLGYSSDDDLANYLWEKCAGKGEFEGCNIIMPDGTMPLAFSSEVYLYDSKPSEDNIRYKVEVIFSEEQANDAKNEDGYIDDLSLLDWDDPQEIIIKEI